MRISKLTKKDFENAEREYTTVKTKDIWDYIESGNCQIRHTGANQIGQADFYVIPWDKYKQAGNKIKIYEKLSVGGAEL